LNLISGDVVSDLNPWWTEKLLENSVPDSDQVKHYNGFFVVPCGSSCTDEDTYVITCVQFSTEMEAECDDTIGWCAGGATYGWAGQQSDALIRALEMPHKQHPSCPYGCQRPHDWWMNELDQRVSDANKSKLDYLCIQDDKYYLYWDPQSRTDTCVGHSFENLDDCPLSSYVMCSSTDNGRVTYGWVGQQAQALERAFSSSLNRHPHCL